MRMPRSEGLSPLRGSVNLLNSPTPGWHPGLYSARRLRRLLAYDLKRANLVCLSELPTAYCFPTSF